jgi:hypothetical protein
MQVSATLCVKDAED